MKVFVLGSRGYIAQHVSRRLRRVGRTVVELSSHPTGDQIEFNLLTPQAFDYSRIQAGDCMLLTAAVSSPDVCRDQTELVWAINVIGTSRAIESALSRGAHIVFFSSDTVYGYARDEQPEDAALNPVGLYAEMKCEIETRFAHMPSVKVLRLSYVFSRNDKFTLYLENCVRQRKSAEIFHPFLRRIVYLNDLLDLLERLCGTWDHVDARVVNVCGPELLSRIDVVSRYQEIVSQDLQYFAITPPPEFFQGRPQVVNMSCRLFENILGRRPRNLRDAMLTEFQEQDKLGC